MSFSLNASRGARGLLGKVAIGLGLALAASTVVPMAVSSASATAFSSSVTSATAVRSISAGSLLLHAGETGQFTMSVFNQTNTYSPTYAAGDAVTLLTGITAPSGVTMSTSCSTHSAYTYTPSYLYNMHTGDTSTVTGGCKDAWTSSDVSQNLNIFRIDEYITLTNTSSSDQTIAMHPTVTETPSGGSPATLLASKYLLALGNGSTTTFDGQANVSLMATPFTGTTGDVSARLQTGTVCLDPSYQGAYVFAQTQVFDGSTDITNNAGVGTSWYATNNDPSASSTYPPQTGLIVGYYRDGTWLYLKLSNSAYLSQATTYPTVHGSGLSIGSTSIDSPSSAYTGPFNWQAGSDSHWIKTYDSTAATSGHNATNPIAITGTVTTGNGAYAQFNGYPNPVANASFTANSSISLTSPIAGHVYTATFDFVDAQGNSISRACGLPSPSFTVGSVSTYGATGVINAVAGATQYKCRVLDSSNSQVGSDVTAYSTSCVVSNLSSGTAYSLEISSFSPYEGWGSFSAPVAFTTTAQSNNNSQNNNSQNNNLPSGPADVYWHMNGGIGSTIHSTQNPVTVPANPGHTSSSCVFLGWGSSAFALSPINGFPPANVHISFAPMTQNYYAVWNDASCRATSSSSQTSDVRPTPQLDLSGLKVIPSVPAVTGGTGAAAAAGINLTGKNLPTVSSVSVAGQAGTVVTSTDTALNLTLPVLAPGSYDIVLKTSGAGSITIQNGLVVAAPVSTTPTPVVYETTLPVRTTLIAATTAVSGFAKGKATVGDAQKATIQDVVKTSNVSALECVGETYAGVSAALATKRAAAVCAAAKAQNPSLVTSVSVSPATKQDQIAPVVINYKH